MAALGLAAYAAVIASAASSGALARAAGAAVALSAFAFSGYLLVVQLAVIGTLCDWCLASDGVLTLLTPLAVLRLRPNP